MTNSQMSVKCKILQNNILTPCTLNKNREHREAEHETPLLSTVARSHGRGDSGCVVQAQNAAFPIVNRARLVPHT